MERSHTYYAIQHLFKQNWTPEPDIIVCLFMKMSPIPKLRETLNTKEETLHHVVFPGST